LCFLRKQQILSQLLHIRFDLSKNPVLSPIDIFQRTFAKSAKSAFYFFISLSADPKYASYYIIKYPQSTENEKLKIFFAP